MGFESNDWKNDILEEASAVTEDTLTKFSEICLSDGSEDMDQWDQTIPKSGEVLKNLDKIERFVIRETPEAFMHLNAIRNAVIEWKVKNENKIQTSITDYFS